MTGGANSWNKRTRAGQPGETDADRQAIIRQRAAEVQGRQAESRADDRAEGRQERSEGRNVSRQERRQDQADQSAEYTQDRALYEAQQQEQGRGADRGL